MLRDLPDPDETRGRARQFTTKKNDALLVALPAVSKVWNSGALEGQFSLESEYTAKRLLPPEEPHSMVVTGSRSVNGTRYH